MSTRKRCVAAFMVWAIGGPAQAADAPNTSPLALANGAPTLDLRLRAEHVDSESATQVRDATATTLRARLGFTTGTWRDFDASLEYEGVTAWDKLDYNNGTPTTAETLRPAIADPTGTELNQAWLRYAGIPATTLQAGRLRFVLDNQRWVGNVGWRQNEQTYDGVVLVNKSLPGTEFTYAHVHNVNSILFTNVPLRANLVNFAYSPGPALKASLYSYWLDFEAANVGNRQDSQTQGVRLAGTPALTDTLKLLYTAEVAQQSEFEEASPAADVEYGLVETGVIVATTTLKAGYEVLGSNDGLYALQTPLATLHAHDGWADLFLVTPANGLHDAYASLGSLLGSVTLAAAFHRFAADYGGEDYGHEIDASLGYAFTRQLSALAKLADYDATTAPGPATFAGNVDTAKAWVQLDYKF
jgi:hypothetical protein